MCGPLSPSASEEIPQCVVRSDRQACDALAPFRQDAAATARPALPSQRKSIHTNLSDTFEMVVIVCYRLWYIIAQSHSHNMFDAFVRQLIILHCSGGMSLILSNHIKIVSNDHDPDDINELSILRQRLQGVTEGGNPEMTEQVRDNSCHSARPLHSEIAPELIA